MDSYTQIQKLIEGFDSMPEQSLAALEAAREAGQKVVGVYCVFAPVEIIRAAGAIPVGLCGKKQQPIAAAEAHLPANLCPLIKSSYGFAITDTCPFFAASDAIVGETTCDGKKKMYELLGRLKPLHLMHLPYDQTHPHSQDFWKHEVQRFADFMEEFTGNSITPENLSRQVFLQNRVRDAVKKLHVANSAGEQVRLTGQSMLPVLEASNFWPDLEDYVQRVETLTRLISETPHKVSHERGEAPRVLLTGTPIGKGSDKVLKLIENAGGVVVGMENCTGLKSVWDNVEEGDVDPLESIARRYLRIPCSCMTPNQGRVDILNQLIRLHEVDAVVDLTWHACHTYMVEAYPLSRTIGNENSAPVLHLCTDYGESDLESLRTRIEAFFEIL